MVKSTLPRLAATMTRHAPPVLTTKDIRVNGYPSLHIVLAHFDAMPVLIEALKRVEPAALAEWDRLRQLDREPIRLVPISHDGELVLNPEGRV